MPDKKDNVMSERLRAVLGELRRSRRFMEIFWRTANRPEWQFLTSYLGMQKDCRMWDWALQMMFSCPRGADDKVVRKYENFRQARMPLADIEQVREAFCTFFDFERGLPLLLFYLFRLPLSADLLELLRSEEFHYTNKTNMLVCFSRDFWCDDDGWYELLRVGTMNKWQPLEVLEALAEEPRVPGIFRMFARQTLWENYADKLQKMSFKPWFDFLQKSQVDREVELRKLSQQLPKNVIETLEQRKIHLLAMQMEMNQRLKPLLSAYALVHNEPEVVVMLTKICRPEERGQMVSSILDYVVHDWEYEKARKLLEQLEELQPGLLMNYHDEYGHNLLWQVGHVSRDVLYRMDYNGYLDRYKTERLALYRYLVTECLVDPLEVDGDGISFADWDKVVFFRFGEKWRRRLEFIGLDEYAPLLERLQDQPSTEEPNPEDMEEW